MVFDPANVKSATGNSGNYDKTKHDLTEKINSIRENLNRAGIDNQSYLTDLEIIVENLEEFKKAESVPDYTARGRRAAVQYLRHRRAQKVHDKLTSSEKKRIEKIINGGGSIITLITRNFAKKVQDLDEVKQMEKQAKLAQEQQSLNEMPVLMNADGDDITKELKDKIINSKEVPEDTVNGGHVL